MASSAAARQDKAGQFGLLQRLPWLLLCALPGLVGAADTALRDYFQESWRTGDGLPHNLMLDIEQSRDGYMWLATWEGVVRFNGHDFELLTEAEVPGLSDRSANELAMTADGDLLVGMARGELLRRGADGWRSLGRDADGAAQAVYSLLPETDRLLVGTAGDGLWQLDEQGYAPLTGSDALSRSIIFALARQDGRLWIGADSGLYRLDQSGLQRFRAQGALPALGVLSLAVLSDGALAIGTERGVFRLDGDSARPLHADLPDVSYESLLVDQGGDIWLGTATEGVFRLSQRGVEQLSVDDGLPSNRVVSLFEDRERSLWLGTSSGLFRLRAAPFVSLTARQGLDSEYVRTLLELPDGRILAGTSGGLALIARGRDGDRVAQRLLPDESVLSAVHDADGALWIGTYYNGVLRVVDGEVTRRIDRESGLPSPQIRALLGDPDGTLWIGSNRGLARLVDERIEVFSSVDGLPSESVLSLYRDRAGTLWVGTALGIATWNRDGFVSLPLPEQAAAQRVYGFSEDAEGRLYVAHDRGVARRVGDSWQLLSARQGLPLGAVFAVLFDAQGNLWLSSNRGVLRIERDVAERALEGDDVLSRWELFGEADGMASSQNNGAAGQPALSARDGELWFATARGVTHVAPQRLDSFSRVVPRVLIEHAGVDGQRIALDQQLEVPPQGQRIDIGFVGLNFQTPKKIRYRYQLEGFDAGWVYSHTNRNVQFTNLAPGAYRFRAQAANPSGDWSPYEAELRIVVAAWWWERPAVQLGLGLLALLLLLAGIRWRLHRLEALRARLQQRVEQATADLQQQTDVLQERNIELDAYAHSVAHDLKNPLATVVGMSSLIRTIGASMAESQRLDMISRIHAAGTKMVEIIDSLLLLSHARSDVEVPLARVDLSSQVKEALKGLAVQIADAGASIEVHEPLPDVVGFAPWVDRVLTNYLANAIKYGGNPPRIELGAWSLADGSVEVWVKDHGTGLSDEAQARLFQPFSRAGRVGGDGHGLGLSIVRRIVERMGGSVGCDSAAEEGARFWLRLPAATQAPRRKT